MKHRQREKDTVFFYYDYMADSIEVVGGTADETTSFLLSLKTSTRAWDGVQGCWRITPEILPKVVDFMTSMGFRTNVASLPPELQHRLKDHLKNETRPPQNVGGNPYGTLYLLQGAPQFLVKAVYKSLAKHYHPDNLETGNATMFRAVQTAYETLTTKRS